MMNTTFFKKLTVILVALFFASCDKDYTTLGTDIVGNENFDFGPGKSFGVKAYNQKVPPVQTNNLPLNQFGTYENEIFGTTTAGFVTQLSLATVKPTFTSGIVVDSVLLTIPYFSTKISTDETGKGIYKLESIQGTGTINFEVYRSGVYLRDYDPNSDFITAQKYFSDEENTGANFYANRKDGILNNSTALPPHPNENTAFIPDAKEYIRFKPTADLTPGAEVISNIESRSSPRMTLHLDKEYFRTEILNKANNTATEDDFADNAAFKNYFKGLYFRVVSGASGGTLMNLDLSKGNVTIYYKQHKTQYDDSPAPVMEMKSLVMNMTGNTVNLFSNVDKATYSNAVTNPDKVNGDERIYLKGGVGSTAYIELFSGTELQELRNSNILVNDASLTFTVDQAGMSPDYKRPLRIYVFDADNNSTVLDYYYDDTAHASDSRLNKSVYDGLIQEVKVGNVTKYKYRVRITQHVNNIIKNTAAKNIRLGVVVTENINMPGYAVLKSEILDPDPLVPGSDRKFTKLPAASVINPLGIRFFGTHPNVLEADRIKFEIFYTKPN